MNYAKQLKKLQDGMFNGRQADLARQIGKSPAQLNQWLNGYRNLSDGMALKIEKQLGLPDGWLSNNEDIPATAVMTMPAQNIMRYELLDVSAAAGRGYYNDDFPETVQLIDLTEEWARKHLGANYKSVKLITAKGDSMKPTIDSGDILFVDTAAEEYNGEGIYIISAADGVKVKRLQSLISGGMLVISDNQTLYRSETISAEDWHSVLICGRVIYHLAAKEL